MQDVIEDSKSAAPGRAPTDAPPATAETAPDRVQPSGSPVAAAPATPTRRAASPFVVVVHVLILLVLSVALLAPGIDTLPVTDRDEARFVQATRQMLETGDWIDIRFQEDARYKKPIGIYWLQALSVTAIGGGPDAPLWAYRLPSLAGVTLAVLFAYGAGVALFGTTGAFFGALLVAATVLSGVEARFAKTDGMLLATIVAAQWALASLAMDPERRVRFGRNALFWTALGFGILVKGPVAPLVVGLTLATLLVYDRSFRLVGALKPLFGLPWLLLLVLPWFVAIASISDGAFFQHALGEDFASKIAAAQESHGAPPGTYLLASFGTFWPASAFIPLGIAWAVAARNTMPARVLIAWALPSWIVFEAVATKLPHYVLPLLPALTLMVGGALAAGVLAPSTRWRRVSLAWIALGGIILSVGLNGAFIALEGHADPIGIAGAVVAGALALVAWVIARKGYPRIAILASAVASGAVVALGWVHLMPAAKSLWLSDRVAETVTIVSKCTRRIAVGYTEPSLVVRLGTDTRLLGPDEGAAAFTEGPCAVALVDARRDEAFVAALAARSVTPTLAGTVMGRNIDGLRLRTIRIYTRDGGVSGDGAETGEPRAAPTP